MRLISALFQYVGQAKPLTPLQWLCLNITAGFVGLAVVPYYRILDQVNAQSGKTGRTFNRWQRDPFAGYRLMKTHRTLYPKSRLPAICVAGFFGMLAMAPVMILVFR